MALTLQLELDSLAKGLPVPAPCSSGSRGSCSASGPRCCRSTRVVAEAAEKDQNWRWRAGVVGL